MHWIMMPFRRAFDFSGRSRRKEFAPFFLVFWLAIPVVLAIVSYQTSGSELSRGYRPTSWPIAAFGALMLALLIPTISLSIRRLHDFGKSGWWLLIVLIPYIGWLIVIPLAWFEGAHGPNKYGPDLKEGERAALEKIA